jgi:cyclin E
MLKEELFFRVESDYFKWQTNITKQMRLTLLSWMMEVCIDMRFQRSTYHMAVCYTDKLFEKIRSMMTTDKLQLSGVTAIYMAAKMEEVFVPEIKYFSKATNYSSSIDDICDMERHFLKVLQFRLLPVTLLQWMDWYTLQWDAFADQHNMHALTEQNDCYFR